MEFEKLIEVRRSVRKYKEGGVPHEDLLKIVKNAQMAPSWKNQQTSRCYVIESPEVLKELRYKLLPEFNAKNTEGAALIVTTFVKDVVGFDAEGVAVNKMGNYWGAYDLGLHDAYMVLAASDAGYDSLIMGIRNEDEIRKALSIPENEVVASVIAVGKRDQEPSLRPRKATEEVVKFL